MKFFKSFPKLISNNEVLTNLLVRTDLLPSLSQNSSLFYKYEMRDGDTPEIIASKYYDDPYRYWLFLYSNNIMDPQWDLVLSTKLFDVYLESKYKDIATENNQTVLEYTQTTVKYYYKNITTVDSYSKTTSSDDYQIDYETYLELPESQTFVVLLDNGFTSTLTTSKFEQNIYDHEVQLNENKRTVKIMDVAYTKDMENQMTSLLRS
jgi:hypothetical protein